MLYNMRPSDPPIILTAHTNHAIDQLLRHLSGLDPGFIRLGGMTTDVEIIKPRTLYEIKQAIKSNKMPGGMRGSAHAQLKKLTAEFQEILEPLACNQDVFPATLLRQYEIISEAQYTALIEGAKEWLSADGDSSIEEIDFWLGKEKVQAEQRIAPENFGIEVEIEEIDYEVEQLKEIEAESRVLDDRADFETLRGARVVLKELWAGRKVFGTSNQSVLEELKKENMWDIPAKVCC